MEMGFKIDIFAVYFSFFIHNVDLVRVAYIKLVVSGNTVALSYN